MMAFHSLGVASIFWIIIVQVFIGFRVPYPGAWTLLNLFLFFWLLSYLLLRAAHAT
jgi:hypothetical protein